MDYYEGLVPSDAEVRSRTGPDLSGPWTGPRSGPILVRSSKGPAGVQSRSGISILSLNLSGPGPDPGPYYVNILYAEKNITILSYYYITFSNTASSGHYTLHYPLIAPPL